ncbi:hypothetical protein BcepF1.074 [Burkholderia phage BcepF1]|uniref:Uncharacterized protein n=1 Tax=Burkholderia phage BcepF1 TaxID=2886897 RepID=A1YZX8_9CAUD|nr:hypothetical protein BcepF1.074 [Burkholderia phage BcepF1]ABL96805.1 hypothetical protein BcepF1.074 [Burkholderia phage BcepF1]
MDAKKFNAAVVHTIGEGHSGVQDDTCIINVENEPSRLAKIILLAPQNVRIVTDVGASSLSGWDDVKEVIYWEPNSPGENAVLELKFM